MSHPRQPHLRALGPPVARYRRIARADRERNASWSTAEGSILAVRHPMCQAGFHDEYLTWLERNFASIRRRFRLALLPCREIDLDGVRLLATWLQDPIADWSPGALARAVALVERCAARGIPTVNHPSLLARASRLDTARRLAAAGIRTPRMLPVDAASAAVVRTALPGPILIREDGGHRRPSLLVPPDRAIEPSMLAAYRRPIAVEFVDTRSPDGLIRKRRCLMLGDRAIAGHLIAAREWEVRGGNKVTSADLLEEEAAFIAESPDGAGEFRRAQAALGLDIAAFDYGRLPDGGTVVWEANPYPFIRFGRPDPELRFRDLAVHRCYGAMARLHLTRAGLPVPPAIEMLCHYDVPKMGILVRRLWRP